MRPVTLGIVRKFTHLKNDYPTTHAIYCDWHNPCVLSSTAICIILLVGFREAARRSAIMFYFTCGNEPVDCGALRLVPHSVLEHALALVGP